MRHDLFDNDAIVLKNMSSGVTLKTKKGEKAIHVEYPDMQYLGIWHCPKTEAPYICIEPWTSLPSRQQVIEDFATQPSMIMLREKEMYQNQISITFKI